MLSPETNELEQRLLELIAENQRGIEAHAACSALRQNNETEVTQETFDELVLRLQQLNQIVDDRTSSPPRRILRTRTVAHWGPPAQIGNESELEPHVEGFLWRRFGEKFLDSDAGSYSLVVQNTAHGGNAAGLWTRPDLAAAVITRYTYAPSPQLDLYGFELKMPSGCTVYAIHEALAHTTFVHFAYLVVYIRKTHSEWQNLPRMIEQAQKHGVGIIIVADPLKDDTYEIVLAAQRHSPRLKRIDDFISQRFDRANQLALRAWISQ